MGHVSSVPEPSAEQCTANAPVHVSGRAGVACWYPQMGGYTAPALIIPDGSGCVDVLVWHDGSFPFGDGHSPTELHHCDPGRFAAFGELAGRVARQAPGASRE